MPNPETTPEEKLLRIIESPGETVKKMRLRFNLQRVPEIKLLLKGLQAQYGEYFKGALTLKTANAFLIVLAAGTTVFLGLDFWIGSPSLRTIQRLEAMAKKMDIGSMAIEHLNPLDIYVQEITQRNIFALPPPSPKTPPQEVKKNTETTSFLTSLRVVGIIWSEAPQAIIEDTKEGKTYFLNRGSKVKEARVKDILKDRVILSYDNQEIEIR